MDKGDKPETGQGGRAWLQLVCCAPLGTVVPKFRVGSRDRNDNPIERYECKEDLEWRQI
jgi:hypothetical protein